jgi:outer membrane immunogenic protein
VYKAVRPVAPVDTWSGFYFGGHIGGGWTNNGFSDPLGVIAPGGAVVSAKDSGFLGGVQLGYNWQYNWFVAGIQGDIGFTDFDASVAVPSVPAAVIENDTKWISTLTGRLGFTWDKSLFYAKGGEAWVRNHYAVTIPALGGNATSHTTRPGYVAGAGWEYAFAPSWSGFLEYDYIGLNDKNITLSDPVFGPSLLGTKQNIQMVKAGVNFRFAPWR